MVVRLQQKFIIKQIIAEFLDQDIPFPWYCTLLGAHRRRMVYWEQFTIVPLQQYRSDPCILDEMVSSSLSDAKLVFAIATPSTSDRLLPALVPS